MKLPYFCKDCEEDPSGPGWEVFLQYHDLEQGKIVACYFKETNEALKRAQARREKA